MQRIEVAERRARLAVRHHLAPTALADSPVEAAGDMVGLHSTDPASVYLAALARTRALDVATMVRVLYDERTLLRLLGMRRTMFVVPLDLAAIILSACTREIGQRERRRVLGFFEEAGVAPDPQTWLSQLEEATLAALGTLDSATATELTREVPGLAKQIRVGIGKRWEGTIGVSTRILFLLAAEGRILRGRPRGSWISSQYRWARLDRWIPAGLPDWETGAARSELIRRWLATFGPGTVADLKWWSGWTLGQVRQALAAVDHTEVDLDGVTGIVLRHDVEGTSIPGPWVALLPALDSTVMGWTERRWYLGEHGRALFDTNGNAGPTVWSDGRVVGGWVHGRDGGIAVRLLEDIGREATEAVDRRAAEIGSWLGTVRVTPRFRTPLEQELLASG